MELEQLRQLVTIADEGTMQAAATRLHLSPSALSRSLHRLEDELGQQLFDRTKNSMRINDRGRLALEHARAILAEERRLRDDFAAIAKRARTIRVASVAPAPAWRLSSLVLAQHPTTIIEPDIVAAEEARGRLLNGACDLAVPQAPSICPSPAAPCSCARTSLPTYPRGMCFAAGTPSPLPSSTARASSSMGASAIGTRFTGACCPTATS